MGLSMDRPAAYLLGVRTREQGGRIMDERIRISIPADDEGFVSFQCPNCHDRFKLHAAEVDEEEWTDLYCPLCGLSNEPGAFLTPEVREVAQAHAENLVQDLLDDMLKGLEQRARSNKFIKFTRGSKPRKVPIPELREVSDLAIAKYPCCGRSAKVPHSDALSGTYCPYCGTEHV